MTWEGLSPPYRAIVADPPWSYAEGWPEFNDRAGVEHTRRPLPYSAMTLEAIRGLPVGALRAADAYLFLWTTNRYLRDSYGVCEAWGFRPAQVLVWCKPPMGVGPGGTFAQTTEYVLVGRHGTPGCLKRVPSTWHVWSRGAHSEKPAAFYDLVESVTPGPYVDLFNRQPRFGWDSWGDGFENFGRESQPALRSGGSDRA